MEKITKKMCAKASPRPRFILANNSKQPLQARNSVTGQDFEKMKGPCTSDHSIFRLQNKVKNIPLLVMY